MRQAVNFRALNYSPKFLQAAFNRSNTVSRPHNSSTASSDGVCAVPITSTRTGMASCGIFMPVARRTSLIASPIAALSQGQVSSILASMPIAGRTPSTTCLASSSGLGWIGV